LIEIWETFLMQLDTEEGETFVPPAGVVASSAEDQSAHNEEREGSQTATDAANQREESEVDA
jgi:sorting nexin-1/2